MSFGILIGLSMGFIFERAKGRTAGRTPTVAPPPKTETGPAVPDPAPQSRTVLERAIDGRFTILFVLLMVILIVGASPLALELRVPVVLLTTLLTIVWALKANSRAENENWMRETYFFVKMILPLLLVGVFVAGVASELIPEEVVGEYLGDNSVSANAIAVGFGIFMYFPTLVEVPVARMFLDLGMAKGPLLAYLLADPELSFQSVLVTRRIMGNKKVAVYVLLVAVLCIVAGLMFGSVVGGG